jgi:hypothetical protein
MRMWGFEMGSFANSSTMLIGLLILSLLKAKVPVFESIPIYDQFDSNSYLIISSSLSTNALPSIVFGSINGDIYLYANKTTTLIAHLEGAVHGAFYDINQDGHKDLIIVINLEMNVQRIVNLKMGFYPGLKNLE